LRALALLEEDPTVRPVLLVHGIWKSGSPFRRMSRHLRRRGVRASALEATEQLALAL